MCTPKRRTLREAVCSAQPGWCVPCVAGLLEILFQICFNEPPLSGAQVNGLGVHVLLDVNGYTGEGVRRQARPPPPPPARPCLGFASRRRWPAGDGRAGRLGGRGARGSPAATVNVQTQEAIEVLAVCLYQKYSDLERLAGQEQSSAAEAAAGLGPWPSPAARRRAPEGMGKWGRG